jgi:hypothetical protein
MRYPLVGLAVLFTGPALATEFPKFKMQEIDTGLKRGCAVLVVDVDGDKKPDIVVVDQHKVVWYRNPGAMGGEWKKYTILDGKTRPDNVCVAALDIDGDGLPELVLGAGWKPFDTATAAQLVWLKRGKDVTQEWTVHELPCDEPMVHRLCVADLDRSSVPSIIVAPLIGRGATENANWTDGRPVRLVALKVPAKNPEKKENWNPVVLSEQLTVVHGITVCYQVYTNPNEVASILTASHAGVHALWIAGGKVTKHNPIALIDPNKSDGPRAAREVVHGCLRTPKGANRNVSFTATIESWGGKQIVVYSLGPEAGRVVLDENLRWGNALRCADLDGDGGDEIVVGVRDDPNPRTGDRFKERRGVRVYKCTDDKGEEWTRHIIDNGGIAVADLAVADLNNDGKNDVIAVGRETGNVRIYWNLGK